MTVDRRMHFLPFLLAALLAAILAIWWRSVFFGNAKATFETSTAILGLVGTAATFIEVLRALSISAVLQANIGAALDRKRVSDMTRLVQEVRTTLEVLERSAPVGLRTLSDIAGQLRALYPDELSVGGFGWPYFETEVRKIAQAVTEDERTQAITVLTLIRNHLEGEMGKISRQVNSLPLGGSK